jgi:hypothetical protein
MLGQSCVQGRQNMRYVSAERTIAAAGAAFAYTEDETIRHVEEAGVFRKFRAAMWRMLLVTGLVVA